MLDSVVAEMELLGYRIAVVPARHLDDLGRALNHQHQRNLFDERFFNQRLAGFDFKKPGSMPESRSLIAVAYPDPHVRFTFEWEGKHIPVAVPATYLDWQEKDSRAERALGALLGPAGYRLTEARVPKKLLAVQSGLAEYGRNNVTYVEGMGSLCRLAAFFSDLPCEEDVWREPAQMERCEDCRACVKACPSGAIDPARFLLRAERCVTFWNEQPAGVAFPEWLDQSWHNCLIGCLHCQKVCPENRQVGDRYREGAAFSEEETRLLLEGAGACDMPAGLRAKLEGADLLEMLDAFARNLGALIAGQAVD